MADLATRPNTAVITVNPVPDPMYQSLLREVKGLAASITGAVVDSPEAVVRITADANLASKVASGIEALRKKYKDPIIQHGREIDTAFKVLSDPLDKAKGDAATKIRSYNDEQRRKQAIIDADNARKAREAIELQHMIDEENEKLRAQQTVDQDTGEVSGPDLIAPEPPPVFTPPAPVIQKAATVTGSATEKMVARWKIIDFKLLPDEYKLPNEKALNAVTKAGVSKIPGVEIWMEPEVSFRAKRS